MGGGRSSSGLTLALSADCGGGRPCGPRRDLPARRRRKVQSRPRSRLAGPTQTIDWDSLFDVAGAEKALPPGFTATGFSHRDFTTRATNRSFNTMDGSTLSRHRQQGHPPITPGWQCNRDNNVLSKNDIMNAYAASYEVGRRRDPLHFSLECNANTGTANVAFWFLQDDTVNCESPGRQHAVHRRPRRRATCSWYPSSPTVAWSIRSRSTDGRAARNGALNPNPVAQRRRTAPRQPAPDTAVRARQYGHDQHAVAHIQQAGRRWQQPAHLGVLRGRTSSLSRPPTSAAGASTCSWPATRASPRCRLTATLFDFSRGPTRPVPPRRRSRRRRPPMARRPSSTAPTIPADGPARGQGQRPDHRDRSLHVQRDPSPSTSAGQAR